MHFGSVDWVDLNLACDSYSRDFQDIMKSRSITMAHRLEEGRAISSAYVAGVGHPEAGKDGTMCLRLCTGINRHCFTLVRNKPWQAR